MTVSTETNRWTFNGNGVTTSFSYTNLILADTDLEIFLSGVLQILVTDYSVTGVGDPVGGNIVFVVAPPSGTANVVAVRNVPAVQPIDYVEGAKFPAESHERGLDRGIIVNQQNQAALLRTLRLADSDPAFSIEALPDIETLKGARLGFDLATGKPIAVTDDITGVAATAFGASLMDDVDATAARVTLGLVIGTDVQADLAVPSQVEAEAGAATTERVWTAQRVAQAIAALTVQALAAGTEMLFWQSAAPTGWTRNTTATFNDAALRVMTSGTWVQNTPGTAFSTRMAAGQGSSSTSPGNVSHTHTIDSADNSTGGTNNVVMAASSAADGTIPTNAQGAGSAHTHTTDISIHYVDVIIASKD